MLLNPPLLQYLHMYSIPGPDQDKLIQLNVLVLDIINSHSSLTNILTRLNNIEKKMAWLFCKYTCNKANLKFQSYIDY